MKILHITEDHSVEAGGVTAVVNDICASSLKQGIECVIMSTASKIEPTPSGVKFIALGKRYRKYTLLFSKKLKSELKTQIIASKVDILHLHGFWLPMQLLGCRIANELNIPCILTTHGMLEPWIWTGKGMLGLFKKWTYYIFFARSVFRKVTVFHAITPMEAVTLEKYFGGIEPIVIPNAVNLAPPVMKQPMPKRIIFFIGRIHPKKGVKLLVEAFLESNLEHDWELVIAGPVEDVGYQLSLESFVADKSMQERVQFVGAVFGEAKMRLYSEAWITVVPSFSEVIGMVNLEASMNYCPSITTHSTGLYDWEDGGGTLIEPLVPELRSALLEVSGWSKEERLHAGRLSRRLVEKKYSWDVVAVQWGNLLDNICDITK